MLRGCSYSVSDYMVLVLYYEVIINKVLDILIKKLIFFRLAINRGIR